MREALKTILWSFFQDFVLAFCFFFCDEEVLVPKF